MTEFSEWTEAKQLSDRHQYEDALKVLQAHPRQDAHYYYNLGTLYLKMKRPGEAVAYLEKANRFQPHDTEIQNNLSIAQSELGKSIGFEQLDPASSMIEKLADRIPSLEAGATLNLLTFLLLLLLIRTYLRVRNLRTFFKQPVTLCCMVGLGMTSGIFLMHQWGYSHPPAVCLESTTVRSGPGDHYVQLEQLPTGTKIRILTPRSSAGHSPGNSDVSWQQVRYDSDAVGWVKSNDVLIL